MTTTVVSNWRRVFFFFFSPLVCGCCILWATWCVPFGTFILFSFTYQENKERKTIIFPLVIICIGCSLKQFLLTFSREEARVQAVSLRGGKLPSLEDVPNHIKRYTPLESNLSGVHHCVKLIIDYQQNYRFESATISFGSLSSMCRKTSASYRELEARKKRVNDLEKLYMDMALQKELQVFTFEIRQNSILYLNTGLCLYKFWKWIFFYQKKGKKRKLREDEIICPTSKPVYKWRAERKR